jgi:hypothetical protein
MYSQNFVRVSDTHKEAVYVSSNPLACSAMTRANPLIIFVDMQSHSLIVPFAFLKRKNEFQWQNHDCSPITEDLYFCGSNNIITVIAFLLMYIFCTGYIRRIYTSVLYRRHFNVYFIFLFQPFGT